MSTKYRWSEGLIVEVVSHKVNYQLQSDNLVAVAINEFKILQLDKNSGFFR
jgi:hypothetical protein